MKTFARNSLSPIFKAGLICSTLLFTISFGLNAQIATWTFEPDPGTSAPATVAANVTVADAEFGLNIGNIGFVSGNGSGTEAYSGNAWSQAGLDVTRYLEFTITADPGFTIDVTSVSFDLDRSSTGPQNFSVLISDNLTFATNQVYGGSLNTALASTNFESFMFSETYSGEVIRVRIYGLNASGSTGTLRFDNVVIDGTVSEIVEPVIPTMSQWALFILALSLTSLAVVRIRKTIVTTS